MPKSRLVPSSALRNFLATEAAGGIMLMAAAALAMIVAILRIAPGPSATPHEQNGCHRHDQRGGQSVPMMLAGQFARLET